MLWERNTVLSVYAWTMHAPCSSGSMAAVSTSSHRRCRCCRPLRGWAPIRSRQPPTDAGGSGQRQSRTARRCCLFVGDVLPCSGGAHMPVCTPLCAAPVYMWRTTWLLLDTTIIQILTNNNTYRYYQFWGGGDYVFLMVFWMQFRLWMWSMKLCVLGPASILEFAI